jgi:hypothetical protein
MASLKIGLLSAFFVDVFLLVYLLALLHQVNLWNEAATFPLPELIKQPLTLTKASPGESLWNLRFLALTTTTVSLSAVGK